MQAYLVSLINLYLLLLIVLIGTENAMDLMPGSCGILASEKSGDGPGSKKGRSLSERPFIVKGQHA
ncbi:hypothetical protein [Rhizobium sp. BK379]|uniref:hypothetical protein n=1 Tax=Rhizobium sp. BK379 TaxID=2587059 RepID=UPI001608BB85|nr:hypothetical protein [Rhizobium sp. BK379]MBB3443463.1 hypothetical protein [Rhizobium sp. BK379]